jgi:curved DNA-binding protein CbpA
MDWEEACNILGVQQTASLEEIDAQYRIKAFLLHPDHTRGYPEAVRKKATEEFILVQKAYEFLEVPSNNPISNPPKL